MEVVGAKQSPMSSLIVPIAAAIGVSSTSPVGKSGRAYFKLPNGKWEVATKPKQAATKEPNYGLVAGTIQTLLGYTKLLTFVVQVLNVRNRGVHISDGQHLTPQVVLAPESSVKLLKNPVIRVTVWKMHDDMIHIKGFIVLQNTVNFPVIGSPKLISRAESQKLLSESQRRKTLLRSLKNSEKSPSGGKSPKTGEKSPRAGDNSGPSSVEDASILSSLANINLQPGQSKEISRWAADIARQMQHNLKQGVWWCLRKANCDFNSELKRDLVSHIQEKHLKEFPGYQCPSWQESCLPVFSCVGYLDKHMKEKHKGSGPKQTLKESSPPPAKRMKTLVMSSYEKSSLPVQKMKTSSQNLEQVAENILGSMDNYFLNSSTADHSLEMEEKVEEQDKEETIEIRKIYWEDEVERRVMKAGVLFHCADCKFVHKDETDMVEHIQKTHLPDFPGYSCPLQQCRSLQAGLTQLTTHLQQQHAYTEYRHITSDWASHIAK